MDPSKPSAFSLVEPTAPNLYHRRLTYLLFPTIISSVAICISILSIQFNTPKVIALSWLSFIFIFLGIRTILASPVAFLRLSDWFKQHRITKKDQRASLKYQNIITNMWSVRKLQLNPHSWIWYLDLVLILTVLAFMLYQGWLGQQNNSFLQLSLVLVLYVLSLIPLGMLAEETLKVIRWAQKPLSWVFLTFVFAVIVTISVWITSKNYYLALAVLFITWSIDFVIYISLRLSTGTYIVGKTIQRLCSDILAYPDVYNYYMYIPYEISRKLRYDRVAILEPTSDKKHLIIKGEFGHKVGTKESKFPVEQGITGKVFCTAMAEAWNDVRECPYYRQLAKNDDTRAEVAVPIQHKGVIYGVIDVQSHRVGVFGPGDIEIMKIIGETLGAAIAANKSEQILKEFIEIDEELRDPWVDTEQSVFESFANFAMNTLGGDQVIYYPLSSTGFPTRIPYLAGDFNDEEAMKNPVMDVNSSLIKLIKNWEPRFEEVVDSSSILFTQNPALSKNFVTREEVISACFFPIGTFKDPLGALFLNFRKPIRFDPLFQATLLSFARAFSTVAARVRYQYIFYKSFGRPELNVHSIKNRHLSKGSLHAEGRRLTIQNLGYQYQEHLQPIYDLLKQVDLFIEDITLAQATIPPNFHKNTLVQVLENVISNLPLRSDGRRPNVALNKIDDRIERESVWFKLALYRLATEAINNAVSHGNASKIDLIMKRENSRTIVEISNDGIPLPEDSRERKGERGIYFLLEEFEIAFDAEVKIEIGPQNQGAHIFLSIPCLPW